MPDSGPLLLVITLGLALGSFLNVCIYRLPRKESVVTPASRCPACGRSLRWFDNVPLLGYALLRGRCRACRAPISIRYPLVEITTALLFVAYYWQLGWQPLLVPRLVFVAAMVVLFVTDLEHRILPNLVTVPGIVCGFVFSLFLPPGWVASLLGILIGGGGLWAIAELYYRVRGEDGMGMGDVKMLGMVGAFLGWQLAVLTLVLSSLLGSIVGVLMIAAGQGGMKYALPFGSFLAVAALWAGLTGDAMIDWYLSFY